MSAVYREETKYKPRCEIYGCTNKAAHYIGHNVHVHTGYRLCDECFEKIMVDIITARKKAGKISKKKSDEDALNDFDEALEVMDRDELVAQKSNKLRTYAKLKYGLLLKVGETKEQWVDEILAVRGAQ